jgi:hypothetical protein
MISPTKTHQGFALLLALIISSVVLAIGVSILQISVNQINLSATARESELAFQAAHAGVDCQWYWRNEKVSEYLSGDNPPQNPSISCFGTNAYDNTATRLNVGAGDGTVERFTNTFSWGSPERCTITAMYVLNANGAQDLIVDFENEGVGDDGRKTCKSGNLCTVLVSDGYNRACDEVDSSIFSVQREITVEF